MTLYQDLGLAPGAAPAAIKAAHRRQAKRHHPDAGGDPARFDRIQRAYDILRDPDRRRRYDETGVVDQAPAPSEEKEALELLQAVLADLIGGPHDLARTDLLGAMLAALSARLDAAALRSAEADARILRIADVLARLTPEPERADDPLAALLRHQIGEAEALKRRVERAIQVHAAAMAMVRGYAYRIDLGQGAATYTHAPSGQLHIRIDNPTDR